MHINMKYYVVSIGAIFIALGIGMLVGFNLNYDQELSKQQATIIEDLDKKFENLKTKNDELETALDSSEKNNTQLVEYINSNYEKIIKDELQDKNVGVITTSNDYDYSEQVQKTIKDAEKIDTVIKAELYYWKIPFTVLTDRTINDEFLTNNGII